MSDKMIRKTILVAFIVLIGLYQTTAQPDNKIKIDDDIQLIQINDSIFIHTSWYQTQNFGKVPANGLIIVENGQAIMVDTPWDNEMTKQLTEFIEDSLKVKLVKFIAGHYHEDCIGGLEYLQNRGVESIANSMTVAKCKEDKLPVPSISFTDSLIFDFNGLQMECRYLGGGHTFDNITVWIPEKRILFGGCLIKSSDSENLGYIGEAVLDDWDSTVKKVMKKYGNIEIIIPGHGNYGDSELLTHTIELVERQRLK